MFAKQLLNNFYFPQPQWLGMGSTGWRRRQDRASHGNPWMGQWIVPKCCKRFLGDWLDKRLPIGSQGQRGLKVRRSRSRWLLLQGSHACLRSARRATARRAGYAANVLCWWSRSRVFGQGKSYEATARWVGSGTIWNVEHSKNYLANETDCGNFDECFIFKIFFWMFHFQDFTTMIYIFGMI